MAQVILPIIAPACKDYRTAHYASAVKMDTCTFLPQMYQPCTHALHTWNFVENGLPQRDPLRWSRHTNGLSTLPKKYSRQLSQKRSFRNDSSSSSKRLSTSRCDRLHWTSKHPECHCIYILTELMQYRWPHTLKWRPRRSMALRQHQQISLWQ